MWLILATTEVQFITSGIGLMIYGLPLAKLLALKMQVFTFSA